MRPSPAPRLFHYSVAGISRYRSYDLPPASSHWRLYFILSLFFIVAFPFIGAASTYTVVRNGAWNDPTVWSPAGPPGSGDLANVPAGSYLSIPAGYAAVCGALALNYDVGYYSCGLIFTDWTSSLHLTGNMHGYASASNGDVYTTIALHGGSLTVDGNLALDASYNGVGWYYQKVIFDGGYLTVGGTLNVSGGSYPSELDMLGGGGLILKGALTGGGFISSGPNAYVNFEGTAPQTIPTSTYYFPTLLISNTSASGATLDGNITSSHFFGDIVIETGTFHNNGYSIQGNGNYSFQVRWGATFNLEGTSSWPTGYSSSIETGSTVNYSGASQSVAPMTYGRLLLTGSGTKTINGAVTTYGDLGVICNTTLNGNGIIHGTLFLNPFTLNCPYTLWIDGNFESDGGTLSGGGSVCFNGTSGNIVGSTPATFNNLTIAAPSGVTMANDVVVQGTLTLSSGTLNVGSNYIDLEGSLAVTSGVLSTNSSSDLYVAGAGNIQIPSSVSALHMLGLNTSGGASLNGNLTLTTFELDAGSFATGSNAMYFVNGGTLTRSGGAFSSGTGMVVFNGGGTISGTCSFFDVIINGGVNFGSGSTITHSLQINPGGYVQTNAPAYGTGSTLKYNTGGTYGRSLEWSATSGNGAPYNALVTGNTTLDLGANSGSGTARLLAGGLTIDPGSVLTMNNGGNAMTALLRITHDLDIYGTLVLSALSGGDMIIDGNFTLHSGGTWTPNSRRVYFQGSAHQTIAAAPSGGTIDFPYMNCDGTGGVILSSTMRTNVRITSPGGGTALSLYDSIDLKGNTLEFSSSNNSSKIQTQSGPAWIVSTGGSGGVVISNGWKTVTSLGGTLSFDHVCTIHLSSGLDCGNDLTTINGTLEIDNGGFILNNPPTYGDVSILRYNTGGYYSANVEWKVNAASGAGVPSLVHVQGSGTNLSFGTVSGYRLVPGSLLIDPEARLTLSSNIGGDLKIGGDFIASGTFDPMGRAVFFVGSGTQGVYGGGGGSGSDHFSYLVLAKSSGSVQLGSDFRVTADGGGSAILFNGGPGDVLDLNGRALTIEDGNVTGSGYFSGSPTSNLRINGTGSIASLTFGPSPSQQQTNDVTLASSGTMTLGTDLTINGTLKILSGTLNTNGHWVILGENGSLDESGGTTVQGNVKTTRNIVQTSGTVTFGNMGLDVVLHGKSLGSTTLSRKTGTSLTGNGKSSILRNFKIVPTTNTTLYADLVFHYIHNELNGEEEGLLTLFKSADDGINWNNWSGTLDAGQNTISTFGLYDLSTWTAADNSHIMGNTPAPTTTSISPDSKVVGQPGFSLTVNGTNFISGVSIVHIDGAERATQYVNETRLTADILQSDLTIAAGKNITVYSTGGGGESNSQTFTVGRAGTTTGLAANISPSIFGQTVRFVARVAVVSPGSGVPTGFIGFILDSEPETYVPLAADSAVLELASLPAGEHYLTARYPGDGNYIGSSSGLIMQQVNKAPATVHLSDLAQVYNGTTRPVTVTTSPEGLTTVSVTYNDGTDVPVEIGNYRVRATLTNDNYEALPADGLLKIQATIIATAGPHGAISPHDANIVDPDSSFPCTFLPDDGFCVDSLYIDGLYYEPAADSFTFTHVLANHTIRVTFAVGLHTITASAGPGGCGTVCPAGAVIVHHGKDTTFIVTPASDFRVDSVFINGLYRGTMSGYTFHCVRGDSSIRVVFAPIVVDVSVHASTRWNMMSLPVEYANATLGLLYSHAVPPAYCYEFSAYASKDTLQFGCAYWVRFTGNHDYVITGKRKTVFTVDVQSGWNMIGALSDTALVADITGDPIDLTISRFFGYTGRYVPEDTLLPGKGYWVKASKDGYLTLRCPAALLKSGMKGGTLIAVAAEQPPPPPMDGSEQDLSRVPTEYKLEQAFPNPFNPTTTIQYQLPVDSKVKIRIYSIMGQEVAELVDGVQAAGYRQIVWNASALASGMYFYRIEAIAVDDPGRVFVASKKLMLVK